MKFEIPFEAKIYKEQLTLNFNTFWNVNLKNNRKRLIWAIPMILFGGLIVFGDNYIGFLFVAIGLHYIVNYYNYISYYKKSKSKYFDLVKMEIDRQKNSTEKSIWEFNEDHFKYKGYKYETKIKWEAFNSYRVIDKNLFLDLNVGNLSSYIIGEIEVGENNFQKLTDFVKNKIEDRTVYNTRS